MFSLEFAYVLVEGQRSPISVPKKIIKAEYLENAEKTPRSQADAMSRASSTGSSVEIVSKGDIPAGLMTPVQAPQNDLFTATSTQPQPETFINLDPTVEMPSHCSATGSCFSDETRSFQRNSRVFVFPEGCPGYEVLANSNTSTSKYNNLPFI